MLKSPIYMPSGNTLTSSLQPSISPNPPEQKHMSYPQIQALSPDPTET